ncbi:hypothetical protein HDU97_008539 [Phlyctochytrium planicorne]|nr:hypothetical protein HDU97_008539 [Phlyctochytrium planicorne]
MGDCRILQAAFPGFGFTDNCCGTDAVKCDGSGRITELYVEWSEVAYGLAGYPNLTFHRFSRYVRFGSKPGDLKIVATLDRLQVLDVEGTPFPGPIPQEIFELSNLWKLWLANCQLTGSVPADLVRLNRLREIRLGNNKLEGGIPDLSSLRGSLLVLELGPNRLQGQIPDSVYQLNQLIELRLDNNQPPLALIQIDRDLEGNKFDGNIPDSFGGLQLLELLNLRSNSLTGTIAPLATLPNLKNLFQEICHGPLGLVCPILLNWDDLKIIALELNYFEGFLPEFLYLASSLSFGGNCLSQYRDVGGKPTTQRSQSACDEFFRSTTSAVIASTTLPTKSDSAGVTGITATTSTSQTLPSALPSGSASNSESPSRGPTNSTSFSASGNEAADNPPSIALIAGVAVATLVAVIGAIFGFLYIRRLSREPGDIALIQFSEKSELASSTLFQHPSLHPAAKVVPSPVFENHANRNDFRRVHSFTIPYNDLKLKFGGQVTQPDGPVLDRVPSLTLPYAELKDRYGPASNAATGATTASPLISGQPIAVSVFPSSDLPFQSQDTKTAYVADSDSPSWQKNEPSTSGTQEQYVDLSVPPRGVSRATTVARTATIVAKPLSSWSVEEVAQWLYNDVGVRPDVVNRLQAFKLDGQRLVTLTETDLMSMGVQQGFVRTSILSSIGDGNTSPAGSSSDRLPPYTGV